jgi:hypothetical protein
VKQKMPLSVMMRTPAAARPASSTTCIVNGAGCSANQAAKVATTRNALPTAGAVSSWGESYACETRGDKQGCGVFAQHSNASRLEGICDVF